VEYAGGVLGGTNYFTRYTLDSGWFFPLPMEGHTFFVRGKAGLVTKREGGDLPAYEKFYLGGMNSVRGYEWSSISPTDPDTGDEIGGEKMLLFNIEYIFPLVKDIGLVGRRLFRPGQTPGPRMTTGTWATCARATARHPFLQPVCPLRLEWAR
jgi:outer membrane protein insertion porin family